MTYASHPAAQIFPLMEGEAFAELKADIAANGLREPIWLYDGQVLDGRNRYRACLELGVEPAVREYEGEDLVGFVVSLNLHRRHLSPSQWAMAADRVATLRAGDNQHAQICAPSQAEAAELMGISRRSVQHARRVNDSGVPSLIGAVERGEIKVSTAADLADLTPDEQERVVARGPAEILAVSRQLRSLESDKRRRQREHMIAEACRRNAPLDGSLGTFGLIYADPPWTYENMGSESRRVDRHYPVMETEAICALPVQERCADHAVLFLWATAPLLVEALEVLAAWGFQYRSDLVWDKERAGMGHYLRVQHELLLIGIRGRPPTPAYAARPPSVIRSVRRAHSQKPDEAYEIIERMYPELPKLELFARRARDGWASWGNES